METASREIKIAAIFDAAIDLVWKVWTDAKHICKWWGPESFTSTIQAIDLREGGEWK